MFIYPRLKLSYGETSKLIELLEADSGRLSEIARTGMGLQAISADNLHREVFDLIRKLKAYRERVVGYYS